MPATRGKSDPVKPTIYSVADLAGVSIATVSRVIRNPASVAEPTRNRVVSAIDELHYLPQAAARSLAVKRHEAHGLVLPELRDVYYPELLAGYEAAAAELGQSVILVLTQGKGDLVSAAKELATRVDGLTIMGSAGLATEAVSRLARTHPVVVIAGTDHPDTDTVHAENRSAAIELTTALLKSGRQRMLFVGDPGQAVDVQERYEGYAAAHASNKRPCAPALKVPLSEDAGVEAVAMILAMDPIPDALVCATDQLALAIMDHLDEAGVQVPTQIAVTGWDDVMAARYVRPRLTTVRQPVRELGALAARRLDSRIKAMRDGSTHHREPAVRLPSAVIIRQSCGTRTP